MADICRETMHARVSKSYRDFITWSRRPVALLFATQQLAQRQAVWFAIPRYQYCNQYVVLRTSQLQSMAPTETTADSTTFPRKLF